VCLKAGQFQLGADPLSIFWRKTVRALLLALWILLFWAFPCRAEELLVSAAMGVRELLTALGKDFEKKEGLPVVFNFASSGKLAGQIEGGAEVDVYISASRFWANYLKRKKLLKSVSPFAKTELVVVTYKGSEVTSLQDAETVAVGDRLAPVGKYALQSLKKLGLYSKLKNRLVYAPDVRQIAVWVATKNADAGIIYYSDYLKFKDRLKLLEILPETSHDPIRFYVGIVSSSKKKEIAEKFKEFLLSAPSNTYKRFGFSKCKERD